MLLPIGAEKYCDDDFLISFCSLFIINYLKPCMMNNEVDIIFTFISIYSFIIEQ